MKKIGTVFITALFALALVQGVFAGGGRAGSTSGGGSGASGGSGKYKQAPILNSQNLPPVDQRLPENPKVIKPWEKIGKYGGTMKIVTTNIGDFKERATMYTVGSYEGRSFLIWSMDQKEIIPNIAESWTISADSKDYNFVLRRGLKWSNGDPFTTEDVRFWYEDVKVNQDLNPSSTPLQFTLEVVDETRFIFHYKDPSPLEIYTIADRNTVLLNNWFLPDEYLKKFHIKYNPNADAEAKAAGYNDWKDCFNQKRDYINNWESPTLSPFMLTTKNSSANVVMFERNPYFWAVDTEGNQLPYLDAVQLTLAESNDTVKMRTAAGENDLGLAVIQETFIDYPFYMENARAGNYTVRIADWTEANAMNIHINKVHKDPAKRAVMGTFEFRKAMSFALDRNTIININYTIGPVKSTPRNFAPYPDSPYLDQELANAFCKYDPAESNRLLDGLGLRKNAQGKRTLPNGSPFTLVIDVPNYSPDWIDIGNQIASYWQAVGIDVSARSIDPGLWGQRISSNEFDVSIHTGTNGFIFPSSFMINVFTGYDYNDWATFFQTGHIIWRQTQGKEGIAPDADIQKLWDLGAAVVKEPNESRRNDMVKQIFELHKKNLYILGIGTRMPYNYVVKNYLHNVPPLQNDWALGHGGHGEPAQYYIE
jgi:peptide/nickel transport system substrate-binding protein